MLPILLLSLPSCIGNEDEEVEKRVYGKVMAGVGKTTLDLPIGTPLAGYSARDLTIGSVSPPDQRDPNYSTNFVPSVGIQTTIDVKALWLTIGNGNLIIIKTDLIFPFDGLLFEIEESLVEKTGLDIRGSVVFTTTHSHSAYGTFSSDPFIFFGADLFQSDIFWKVVERSEEAALMAFEDRSEVGIGAAFYEDFDPVGEDLISSDRRRENDGLTDYYGEVTGESYRGSTLSLLTFNRIGEEGISGIKALLLFYGVHGTLLGSDNLFISSEVAGHIEKKVERFLPSNATVFFIQGSAGDVAPSSPFTGFAGLEYIGEIASERIASFLPSVQVYEGEASVETRSSYVDIIRDDMVIREGEGDYPGGIYYTPYSEDLVPDDRVFGEDGTILTPIDEFNALYGAALCGNEDMAIFGGIGSDVYPYSTCIAMEKLLQIMEGVFDIEYLALEPPFTSSVRTVVTISHIKPIMITRAGKKDVGEVILAFFPGEPLSLYEDRFRARLKEEYGLEELIFAGYSQDYEGYLLTAEDWLMGGYEPQVTIWGPIEGEYILEKGLEMIPAVISEELEQTTAGARDYLYFEVSGPTPETTLDAGTIPEAIPDYLFTRDGYLPEDPNPAGEIERITGIATFLWKGGDPLVDYFNVSLEKEDDGQFEPFDRGDGKGVDQSGYETLVSYTPYPLSTKDGERSHFYLIEWQVVNDYPTLSCFPSIPQGVYRFRVNGAYFDGAVIEEYEVLSRQFEVVPNSNLILEVASNGSLLSGSASYPAPDRGFRLLSKNHPPNSPTPISSCNGDPFLDLFILNPEGEIVFEKSGVELEEEDGKSNFTMDISLLSPGQYRLRAEDPSGNYGEVALNIH